MGAGHGRKMALTADHSSGIGERSRHSVKAFSFTFGRAATVCYVFALVGRTATVCYVSALVGRAATAVL